MASEAKLPAEVEILERLTTRYGELIGPADLWKELGFGSPAAAQTARRRQRFPVPAFTIKYRRGYFARVGDVARWLARPQRGPWISTKDGVSVVKKT